MLDVKQGTDEWLDARLGLVTASEVDALISPVKWELKTGEGPKTYLATKLAEAWLCRPVETFGAWAADQGTLLEPRARAWYEATHDCDIAQVGFIVGDDRRCGCSPDGLLRCETCKGQGSIVVRARESGEIPGYVGCPLCDGKGFIEGLEIKSPQPIAATKYALDGVLPPEYSTQVHFSMFVTGFKRWGFVSYSDKLPKLVIEVQRDESKIAVIQSAVDRFYNAFDEGWEKLNERADEPRKNPFTS